MPSAEAHAVQDQRAGASIDEIVCRGDQRLDVVGVGRRKGEDGVGEPAPFHSRVVDLAGHREDHPDPDLSKQTDDIAGQHRVWLDQPHIAGTERRKFAGAQQDDRVDAALRERGDLGSEAFLHCLDAHVTPPPPASR
jgi:hypothetical protein